MKEIESEFDINLDDIATGIVYSNLLYGVGRYKDNISLRCSKQLIFLRRTFLRKNVIKIKDTLVKNRRY